MIKETEYGFSYQITKTSNQSMLVQSKYGRFSIHKSTGDTWELWEIVEDRNSWRENKTLLRRGGDKNKLERYLVELMNQRHEKQYA